MKTILMPLPNTDFDPTESAVPWSILRANGHQVVFATPDGQYAQADQRMVHGTGLGVLAPILRADANGQAAYARMAGCSEFLKPISYAEIAGANFDGLILSGGHAPGMKPYLESSILQKVVGEFFLAAKPVGAICHGVVLAARSKLPSGLSAGLSVLHGKKTTALTQQMELSAWTLTRLWLKNYYRTYPITVEAEVSAALANTKDFIKGPISLTRDSPDNLAVGFTVQDGNYLSARWPGDAHRFATEFVAMLAKV